MAQRFARLPLAPRVLARRTILIFGLSYLLWLSSYFDVLKDALTLVRPVVATETPALVLLLATAQATAVAAGVAIVTSAWSERRVLRLVVGLGALLSVSAALAVGVGSPWAWASVALAVVSVVAFRRMAPRDFLWAAMVIGGLAFAVAWGNHVLYALRTLHGGSPGAVAVAAPAPPAGAPSVYVILLDEVSASLLEANGGPDDLPNISRLMDAGVTFTRAYSVTDSTFTSVPSIWTGRLPTPDALRARHRFPTSGWLDEPNLIADLAALGYRIKMSPDMFATCRRIQCEPLAGLLQADPAPIPADLLRFAAQHLLHQVSFGAAPAPSAADLLVERADAYLPRDGQVRLDHDPARPQLLFVHFIHTHWPYNLTRDGLPLDSPHTTFKHLSDPSAARRTAANAYENLRFADRWLGPIVDQLLAIPEDERIIVLLADHGVSWRDAPYYRIEGSLRTPQVHVPLVIAAPGVAPGRDDELVPLTDLYPTLVGLLNRGADAPLLAAPDGDGVDRFAVPARTRPHTAFSLGCRYELRNGRWLLVDRYDGVGDSDCNDAPVPAEELADTP